MQTTLLEQTPEILDKKGAAQYLGIGVRTLDSYMQRRLAYAREHGGHCPSGWTPPAPGEVERPAPVVALMLRCKNSDAKLICFLKHKLPHQYGG